MYAIGYKKPKKDRDTVRNNKAQQKGRYIGAIPQNNTGKDMSDMMEEVWDDKERNEGYFIIYGEFPVVLRLSPIQRNIQAF